MWPKNQNTKLKQYCNKFNKTFKNGQPQKKREASDYIFYLNSKRDKEIAKGREGDGKWQRDLGEMYYLYSTLP